MQGWDPSGGDIEVHKYASGMQEDIIQSRPKVIALMKERIDKKEVGFLHHSYVDGIIEKNLDGDWHQGSNSVYLWAHLL